MKKLVLAAGVCAGLYVGSADTLTWKGGTGTNWSEPANWTSSGTHTTPQNGDTVALSGTSVNNLGSSDAPLQLAGMTVSGNVTLTGNAIAFPTAGSQISYSGGTFTCGVEIRGTTDSGQFQILGNSGATIVANADIVIQSDLKLNLFGNANVFNGKLFAGHYKSLTCFVNGGQCVYNGPVSCWDFMTGRGSVWDGVGTGTHVFGSSDNVFYHGLQDWRCTMKTSAPNALKGSAVDLGYTFFDGNANLYLLGNDQEIDRFTAPDPKNSWSILTDLRSGNLAGGRVFGGGTGGKVPRLTLNATADCYFVGLIEDDLKLVWNPQGDYTFAVSNRSQKMTSPVIVSNGTFAVEGGTVVFPNMTGIQVAVGAKLRVGTTDVAPFPSMTLLSIGENGKLVCAGEGAAGLSTGNLNAELADGAQIAVASGKLLSLKTLMLTKGDMPVVAGMYTGGPDDGDVKHADWIDGEGRVFVTSVKDVVVKMSTWKGGGADDSLTTDANWKDGEAPNLKNGSANLVFAESGTHALVGETVLANGITDTMIGEFVVDAAPGAKIQLLGGGIASSGTAYAADKRLDINADIMLMASQTWTAYDNLWLNGRLSSLTGGEKLTLDGLGIFYFTNSNSFAGPIDFRQGRIELRGDSPLGDSDQLLTIDGQENSRSPALYLKGARVKRPVYIVNNHQYYDAICSCENTTNVLEKPVKVNGGVKRITFGNNSTLVFADGLVGSSLFDPASANNSWLVFRGTPLNGVYLYLDSGGNVAFESAGSKFSDNIFFCPQLNSRPLLIETRVENAFTADCPMRLSGVSAQEKVTATWDLCGLDQQCGNFNAGVRSFVTSKTPATLTVNQAAAITNRVVFQGAASFVKAGAGVMELSGASTSTGAVTVAAGTLKFLTGSGWQVGQRRSRCNDFTVRSGAKLSLEEGVSINVRNLYLPTGPGGELVKQELGVWGSSEAAGAKFTNDACLAGKGVLNVVGENPGFIFIVK